MTELPSGTVTFLLTDVEASTALWEKDHQAMHAALARHDAIVAGEVKRHGGVLLKHRGEGDTTFAVFRSATGAVTAALAIQRALAAESWPTPGPVRVRIAMHSGEAQPRAGGYYGPTVNRCARLRSLGHGEQSLLSEATATLVRDLLPDGTTLVDLGEHRLKDLARPEHVYQLAAADLRTDFPPLASLDAHRHNLPLEPTPLIGRRREIRVLLDLLGASAARLVTLTGPGGTGKTRLSLQAAAELVDAFDDGVFLVELASIADPGLVVRAIAATLGVQDTARGPLLDVLADYLRPRRLLLLLDNFEQVLAAATHVDALLRTCPRLSILVTSRAPLQLGGEREIPVAPLALPDSTHPCVPEALSQFDAVALFVERATAVRPDFTLTHANARAVAEICIRLDGLPLAIELAAARVRLLSPEALLSRLGHGLALLAGGRRDLPERQQTLRNTIAWSYNLLPKAEQRLLRRLSVFVGGFTLEAAGEVCTDDGSASTEAGRASNLAIDGVEALVTSSLVQRDERGLPGPRFRMLETIREFGLERLEAVQETAHVRDRHLRWCCALVERAAHELDGARQAVWLNTLEDEHDNLRAALAWADDTGDAGGHGLRLAGHLGRNFWAMRGHHREGRAWLDRLLAHTPSRSTTRAWALRAAGRLALRQNDYPAATAAFGEALAIFRELGDQHGIAQTLSWFGVVPHHLGRYDEAQAMLEESLAISREIDDAAQTSVALRFLADLARDRGDVVRAAVRYEDALALAREQQDPHGIAYALRGLGHLARAQGQYALASGRLRASLTLLKPLEDRRCIPLTLEGLACITVGPGWADRAARLLGAAQAMQARTGAPSPPSSAADYQRTLADARRALGGEAFDRAWAEGAAMSLDEAVDIALAEPSQPTRGLEPPLTGEAPAASAWPDVPLSPREREVVGLIAAGLSNREIAERLVLSVRTVERHIENAYNRLGISGKAGRAIVTAYALRHGLAGPD